MEFTQINPITKIEKIDKQSFLKNYEKITNVCLRILASHEKTLSHKEMENAKNYLYNVCTDLFLDGEAYFFVLTRDKKPVSFCIYSAHPQKQNAYIMEMIYTHSQLSNCGYGTLCLEHSLNQMKKLGATEVILTVNNKNQSSMHMHNKLIEKGICKGTTQKDEYTTKFYFDLDSLNLSNDPEACL